MQFNQSQLLSRVLSSLHALTKIYTQYGMTKMSLYQLQVMNTLMHQAL